MLTCFHSNMIWISSCCLTKKHPKKSKNILLSMVKISKNTKNSHSDVTIIYHLRRRPLLPIRWKNAPGVDLLVFLHTCVLLNRLGGDGCGRLRGVVLLNVSCGSGDGSPCLATTDANSKCAKDQRKDEKSFHCCFKFKLV